MMSERAPPLPCCFAAIAQACSSFVIQEKGRTVSARTLVSRAFHTILVPGCMWSHGLRNPMLQSQGHHGHTGLCRSNKAVSMHRSRFVRTWEGIFS